jgi:hypothetical protein
MKWHLFVVGLIFVSSITAFATPKWNLNDVSMLMPLPQTSDEDTLLQGTDSGAMGQLLPTKVFHNILLEPGEFGTQYSLLRAVGIRIDPCFQMDPGPTICQAQVRMVWQIIHQGEPVDAGLHSFYNLTDKQFAKLTVDLQNLKTSQGVSTEGLPLQIHPAIQSQGLKGPFVASLKKLLLKYCGAQNLVRYATMFLNDGPTENTVWSFQIFNVSNEGQTTGITIPRVRNVIQSVGNPSNVKPSNPVAGDYVGARVSPAPSGPDTLSHIFSGQAEASNVGADFIAAYRIENPKDFNPTNMDCVSCHATQQAKSWAIANFPDLNLAQLGAEYAYQSQASNLSNTFDQSINTKIFRAFGHYRDGLGSAARMVVSQRVINESAVIVDWLNLRWQTSQD